MTSRVRFRKLLLTAIAVPAAVMIVITGVMAWQVGRLLKAAASVEHDDQVIAQADETLKLTLDLETGLRGYLLTGDDEFLQPYVKANNAIGSQSAELERLVADNVPQVTLARQIDKSREAWLQYAQRQIELRKHNGDFSSAIRSRHGKVQMDALRSMYHQFVVNENKLRDARSETAQRESVVTLWLVLGAGLIGGVLLAILSRRHFLLIAGTYAEALTTAHDLNIGLESRVRERTLELEHRTDELRDANRELEAFGYSISHDLRAPLRHISGFAELLRGSAASKLTADDLDMLSVIFDTARMAGRMVDDLLSFSRIGRARLNIQDVDLNEVVANCRRDLQLDLKDRQVDWIIEPLPTVSADATLIKMVFQNLISNAVKYTSRVEHARIEIGSLEPEEAAESQPSEGGALVAQTLSHQFFIRDNGVGFDMKFSGKLFGVFQRLHRAEEFEGTGIGLANVRRILGRHGGRVWAEGALDQGATFYFTLPIMPAAGGAHGTA